MDISKVIQHIAQAHIFRMIAYLVFVGSQSLLQQSPRYDLVRVETTPRDWIVFSTNYAGSSITYFDRKCRVE